MIDIILIGHGNVGTNFVDYVNKKNIELTKLNLNFQFINVKYIISSKNKSDYDEALKDDKVKFVIEATPTKIDDEKSDAYIYICKALMSNKNVISANKAPFIKNFEELNLLAIRNKVKLKYSATTGAALPTTDILNSMKGSKLVEINAILNGTSNFILSEMSKGKSYADSLKIAQNEGIAETNPYNDVSGLDTALKLGIIANSCVLNSLFLGVTEFINFNEINIKGIDKLNNNDFVNNYKLKLIGKVVNKNNKLSLNVEPLFINNDNLLFNVDGKNKGIVYKTEDFGDIFLSGGASNLNATSASIYKDILNCL